MLVILNVGYTLLGRAEFKEICFKCVRNDTSGIDWLICGGIYFHSDRFDNYLFAPLEDLPINLQRAFPSRSVIGKAWGEFVGELMTDMIRNPKPFDEGRMPVLDLVFELDGVRFVKPAPNLPQADFWPTGRRPRENSTGIERCPSVAFTFPSLSAKEWESFKGAMPSEARLQATFKDWLEFYPNEPLDATNPLKPFVSVDIFFDDFVRWIQKPKPHWKFSDIGVFSSEEFHQRVTAIIADAKCKEETLVVPLDYIHLVVNEVGIDKANDYASIIYVSEIPGLERTETIVQNVRLFFEYGLVVAGAYAIKRKVGTILFTRRQIC